MFKIINTFFLIVSILLFSFSALYAKDAKPKGMPPAQVVVAEISSGVIAPEAEFIGTVYYQEVSDVASEVSGSVEAIMFDEGQRVNKSHVLVKLNSDILQKTLQATTASHEQALAELENANIALERMEELRREELVSESRYDEQRFLAKGLEKRAASLKAEVERLEVELQKKAVTAPFDGVIIKKHIDRGEWVSTGNTVATIAKNNIVDIVVDVPEKVFKAVKTGMHVKVKAGGKKVKGKIYAVIPSGDISTRTFPVKVRINNSISLIEGMEARVTLPAGDKKTTLTVSRDAVITMFGNTVVFAVVDSKAKMIPVNVIGYEGLTAGISAAGLKAGVKVVVKGNERLSDGQEVNIVNH